jgi:hypothetical protein
MQAYVWVFMLPKNEYLNEFEVLRFIAYLLACLITKQMHIQNLEAIWNFDSWLTFEMFYCGPSTFQTHTSNLHL